mgnify:FL=1
MKIIDSFLPEDYFKLSQSLIMDYGFPWQWNDFAVKDIITDDVHDFQFVHPFYNPLSGVVTNYPRWKDIIKPYADYLNPVSLIRIKANLNVAKSTHIKREFHTDFKINCTTAIAYMNDNDGFTLFEDGTKVESKENRVVVFDSNLKHTGIPCTNQKRRVVINFNFI